MWLILHNYCLISLIFDLQGLTWKYLTLISENYTNHYIRLHFEVYVYRFSLKSIPKSCLKEAATASFISLVCLAAILTSIYMEYSIEVVGNIYHIVVSSFKCFTFPSSLLLSFPFPFKFARFKNTFLCALAVHTLFAFLVYTMCLFGLSKFSFL